jgi:hypothetical protein
VTPCPGCNRHVRDTTCPFCGAAVPTAAPRPAFVGRITRAAVFSAVAGCWTGPTAPDVKQPDDTQHAQGSAAATTGTIEGVATDAMTGEPVAEATVRVANTTIEAKTDEQGHYLLTGLPPGTYTVVIYGGDRNPRLRGAMGQVTVATGSRGDVSIDVPQMRHPGGGIGPNGTPMPYGAPPARRRIV